MIKRGTHQRRRWVSGAVWLERSVSKLKTAQFTPGGRSFHESDSKKGFVFQRPQWQTDCCWRSINPTTTNQRTSLPLRLSKKDARLPMQGEQTACEQPGCARYTRLVFFVFFCFFIHAMVHRKSVKIWPLILKENIGTSVKGSVASGCLDTIVTNAFNAAFAGSTNTVHPPLTACISTMFFFISVGYNNQYISFVQNPINSFIS